MDSNPTSKKRPGGFVTQIVETQISDAGSFANTGKGPGDGNLAGPHQGNMVTYCSLVIIFEILLWVSR